MDLLALTSDVKAVVDSEQNAIELSSSGPRRRRCVLIDINVGQNRTAWGRRRKPRGDREAERARARCRGMAATTSTSSVEARKMRRWSRTARATRVRRLESRAAVQTAKRVAPVATTSTRTPGVTEIQAGRTSHDSLQQDRQQGPVRTRRSPTSATRCPCWPRHQSRRRRDRQGRRPGPPPGVPVRSGGSAPRRRPGVWMPARRCRTTSRCPN
jgi:hypothetical protein